MDENAAYLLGVVHRLGNDRKMQEIWKLSYDGFITPIKAIYRKCHKTLIHEYTSDYGRCMEKVETVLKQCREQMIEDEIELLRRKVDGKLDICEDLFDDLFVLFCMEDSVFCSPDL